MDCCVNPSYQAIISPLWKKRFANWYGYGNKNQLGTTAFHNWWQRDDITPEEYIGICVFSLLLVKFSESKKYSQSMDDLSFWSSPARRQSFQNSPLVRENRIPENPQLEENRQLPVPNSCNQENRLSMPEERVSSPDSSYRSSLSSRSPSRTSPVSFFNLLKRCGSFFLILKNKGSNPLFCNFEKLRVYPLFLKLWKIKGFTLFFKS